MLMEIVFIEVSGNLLINNQDMNNHNLRLLFL